MKRRQLNGKKIGIVFGTFAPMHIGHVDLITKAKRQTDQVLVVVSGSNDDRDRGARAGLSLNRRFRYVREVFYDDDLVLVDKLDEEGMPSYPDGWQPWMEALQNLIAKNIEEYDQLTFFVGEKEYVSRIKDFLPHAQVELVQRSTINISATEIRENPLYNWRFITKPFRRHFTRKVLVVGSASGGKTTMVKDLARTYNAPSSLEYAREYQEKYNVRDDELDTNDYIHLLTDQYAQTAEMIDKGQHQGLVFADTNSTVTKVYIDYYLKESISQEEFDMLDRLYQVTQAREKWDLIFVILPKSDYVDDGFRDMTMADAQTRDWFTQHLLKLLEPFKDKIVILGENSSPENFFSDNYHQAKKEIKNRLHIDI
ncbi:AAA family ATPase [Streptococcus loxodontisalivarius]|uniref:NadR type nicotinamide-nucleotide adenylyltransferase n=1 Tax=Streptococcus loxodontisalivarius TaxID=1349415 RepID=A0ABS2PSB2_9STRE|nr:AAA family ATPase [Streptococcus loxodontisalivarius]MBM7642890.1 NadR type nicotinamide-nucleotide adenylyltransferase [Streptococcus loxodontisalivarius]